MLKKYENKSLVESLKIEDVNISFKKETIQIVVNHSKVTEDEIKSSSKIFTIRNENQLEIDFDNWKEKPKDFDIDKIETYGYLLNENKTVNRDKINSIPKKTKSNSQYFNKFWEHTKKENLLTDFRDLIFNFLIAEKILQISEGEWTYS